MEAHIRVCLPLFNRSGTASYYLTNKKYHWQIIREYALTNPPYYWTIIFFQTSVEPPAFTAERAWHSSISLQLVSASVLFFHVLLR